MAEREEYLVKIAEVIQVNRAKMATTGVITRMRPNAEATPLPPLNFSQTGKLCPMMADVPAVRAARRFVVVWTLLKRTISAMGTILRAIYAAIAALKASRKIVSRVSPLLFVARRTLVAPIVPGPTLRRSPWPESFVTTIPNGTEPKR